MTEAAVAAPAETLPLVRARGLGRRFGSGERAVTALADVDLDVPAGRLLAVRGRSGSGKTTLLNLLAGLDRPDAGTVHLGDVEVSALPEAGLVQLRRTAGRRRVPVVRPGADPQRGGERRRAAAAGVDARGRARRAGRGAAGARRARRPRGAAAVRAVRRPAAAGGDRAGAGEPAAARRRRRADRSARLAHRRRGHGPAAAAGRARRGRRSWSRPTTASSRASPTRWSTSTTGGWPRARLPRPPAPRLPRCSGRSRGC